MSKQQLSISACTDARRDSKHHNAQVKNLVRQRKSLARKHATELGASEWGKQVPKVTQYEKKRIRSQSLKPARHVSG